MQTCVVWCWADQAGKVKLYADQAMVKVQRVSLTCGVWIVVP